ncbi:MAG: metallophosphoesterase [Gemmatimonadales bacterium]
MRIATLGVLLATLALPAGAGAQPSPDRIVAVGDVHGDFERFVGLLRQAGVIDGKNRWAGGKTHLVQTGDVLDRGPESRRVMDLLMALEEQARKAGGKVHALIGNHEAMNILGDLRYVSAGEYEAFRSSRAKELRERAYRALADSALRDSTAYRKRWEAEHPLGWVEHRLAFEGNGKYGTWIRGHDAVLALGGYLFLHGGIGPKYVDVPLEEINARVRKDLEPGATTTEIVTDHEGPLWYRGLAREPDSAIAPLVDRILERFGVEHVVIGHTVTPGAILPRLGAKVIQIDVGLAKYYGGPPACLVIERGVPYALHRGELVPLPQDGDVLGYLKQVAALEPPDSRLAQYVGQLEAAGTRP